MKSRIVLALVVLFAFAAGAGAAGVRIFWASQRSELRWSSPLVTTDGQPVPGVLVHYMIDGENTATCIVVIQNTQTGHLAAATADPSSCARRY